MSGPLFVVILVFCAALVTAFAPRRGGPGGKFYLIRSLLPSWRFFESITEIPVLFIRYGPVGGELGEWEPAVRERPRSLSAVLFNPQLNLGLAIGSLLQQLETEVGELSPDQTEGYESSVSFELIQNLVRYLLRSRKQTILSSGQLIQPVQYQFKIGRVWQGDSTDRFDQFLLSRIYSTSSL